MKKKICIFLCLLLMLGGCGTPARNNSGESLSTDSSKQEESSASQETSKPEESSAPQEGSKPEESSSPQETSKQEESSASQETSKPEESSAPQESSKPEESSAPQEISDPEESSQSANAAWASAYLDIIEGLLAEYGEGQTMTYQVAEGFYGLVVVQLVDFDGDGQPELFCGFLPEEMAFQNEAYQRIYGYDSGLITLFDESAGHTGGVNPISRVKQTKDGTVYLIQLDGRTEDYWVLSDGKFSIDHHVFKDLYTWDEEQLNRETFEARYNDFWTDATTLIDTSYFTVKEGKGVQVLSDTQETIEYLQELAN